MGTIDPHAEFRKNGCHDEVLGLEGPAQDTSRAELWAAIFKPFIDHRRLGDGSVASSSAYHDYASYVIAFPCPNLADHAMVKGLVDTWIRQSNWYRVTLTTTPKTNSIFLTFFRERMISTNERRMA